MDDTHDDVGGSPHGMTDLEERLQGPDGAELRASLMSRLTHLDRDLDAMVRAGLRSDDYTRATEMKAAVVAAQSLLRTSN